MAAFLKLLIPFIVVVPGIAAYVMVNDPEIMARLGELGQVNIPGPGESDKAYPWLLQLLPVGLKGVAFAALAAAIVSSLASMLNSTSTIFTMDIYKQYIKKDATDRQTVRMGRISASVALVIACIMAPLLGGIDQAFQFIQEYTGIVSPGILAVFLLGLFWKKTTNAAAIWGAILSVPIAMLFKLLPGIPFMNQMGLTCLLTMLVIIIVSYLGGKGKDNEKGIELTKDLFKTTPAFNIGAFAISLILVVLYALFW
jgi:SSS family solute:Na+ symporter